MARQLIVRRGSIRSRRSRIPGLGVCGLGQGERAKRLLVKSCPTRALPHQGREAAPGKSSGGLVNAKPAAIRDIFHYVDWTRRPLIHTYTRAIKRKGAAGAAASSRAAGGIFQRAGPLLIASARGTSFQCIDFIPLSSPAINLGPGARDKIFPAVFSFLRAAGVTRSR